jgi:hypothetical protein
MSRALVVDECYRLQHTDLRGAPQRAMIRYVSFQGLEELTPVLHFEGAPGKHLALDASQRRELIQTLHSSLCSDWVGQTIELRPRGENQHPAIEIAAPGAPHLVREQAARWRFEVRAALPSLWAILALALALWLLFWLERSDALLRLILDWLGG